MPGVTWLCDQWMAEPSLEPQQTRLDQVMSLHSEHHEGIIMTRPGYTSKHCFQKRNIKAIVQSHEQRIDADFPQSLIFFNLSPELLDKAHAYPQAVMRSLPHTMALVPAIGKIDP